MNAIEYFEELYHANKYVIKIYNTVDSNWCIYMFKNKHIQLDIQTPNSLSSKYIQISDVVQYICYYDDFEEYKKTLGDILTKIQVYYQDKGKQIHIKYKMYWN
jgi:hypothetical protein